MEPNRILADPIAGLNFGVNFSPGTAVKTQRKKVTFANQSGEQLAGLLELPDNDVLGYVLFAHCFTCGKDISSASRIARGLARHGFATLRFDFTGLGNSDGDFANTSFSSNIEDLVCAADFLASEYQAPAVLIGHSLGGAAVLAAAERVPSARAVVTIGAPFDPSHVAHNFGDQLDKIQADGVAEVNLAGRTFTIKRQFIEDIREQKLNVQVTNLHKALLVFHSPADETVPISEAAKIYQSARQPKSFISLDKADHLVRKAVDAEYIADTLSAWVKRYLPPAESARPPEVSSGHVLVAEKNRRFTRAVYSDTHRWFADEPRSSGGDDLGPDPYEHLLAALGACTSMTMRMYANHKGWPVEDLYVSLHHRRCHGDDCAGEPGAEGDKTLDIIERNIRIEGPDLDAAQIDRLREIANRCPVHKTLTNSITVQDSYE